MRRWLVLFCAVIATSIFWHASVVHAGKGEEKVKDALYESGGGEGVIDVGLTWLYIGLVAFYTFYVIYLGLGVAFGQGDSSNVSSLVIGASISFGAALIGKLFSMLFT